MHFFIYFLCYHYFPITKCPRRRKASLGKSGLMSDRLWGQQRHSVRASQIPSRLLRRFQHLSSVHCHRKIIFCTDLLSLISGSRIQREKVIFNKSVSVIHIRFVEAFRFVLIFFKRPTVERSAFNVYWEIPSPGLPRRW